MFLSHEFEGLVQAAGQEVFGGHHIQVYKLSCIKLWPLRRVQLRECQALSPRSGSRPITLRIQKRLLSATKSQHSIVTQPWSTLRFTGRALLLQ